MALLHGALGICPLEMAFLAYVTPPVLWMVVLWWKGLRSRGKE